MSNTLDGELAWVPSKTLLWKTDEAGATYRYKYVNAPKYAVVTQADCTMPAYCSKIFFDGEHWFIKNKDVYPAMDEE